MLYRRAALHAALKVSDLITLVVSFFAGATATAWRLEDVALRDFLSMRIKIGNLVLFAALVAIWHLILSWGRLYESTRLVSPRAQVLRILSTTALGTTSVGVAAIVFRVQLVTPLFLAVLFAGTASLTIASRLTLRGLLRLVRRHGRNLRCVVIVGTNRRALAFARGIEEEPELGYRLLGFVDRRERTLDPTFAATGRPLVAELTDLPAFLRRHVVDEVFVFLPLKSLYEHCTRVVSQCEEQGVVVKFLSDVFDVNGNVTADTSGRLPRISISTGAMFGWPVALKRALDIAIASSLLVSLSPALVLVAVLVKATSPGPVLFRQQRLGLNKRRFQIYKFRTMAADAEQRLAEVAHLNQADGPVFKIRGDPRVTPLGAFLRKTSIDELPQLVNVLLGDISLVGPRPLPLRDYDGFARDWHRRRFSVRPGITGLWQVSGRSNISFERWMEMDLEYIDNWSLWLDVKILARTIPAVLRGTGAM